MKVNSPISSTEFVHLFPFIILLVFSMCCNYVFLAKTPLSYSYSSLGQLMEVLVVGILRTAFFQSSDLGIAHNVDHFLFRFCQPSNQVNGKSQWQCSVMGRTECLISKYMTMKFFSCKPPQSFMPFNLFVSGYTLSLFPFANESCVSRFITSRVRNAEFLISDIWKELQVNMLKGS